MKVLMKKKGEMKSEDRCRFSGDLTEITSM